jgi:hypothetical protein
MRTGVAVLFSHLEDTVLDERIILIWILRRIECAEFIHPAQHSLPYLRHTEAVQMDYN